MTRLGWDEEKSTRYLKCVDTGMARISGWLGATLDTLGDLSAYWSRSEVGWSSMGSYAGWSR